METYAQLKTDIKDWCSAPDMTDDELDNFIAISISRINRVLRFRGMETTTDLTVNAQEISLPTDFRGARSLYLNTSTYDEVRYMPPEVMHSKLRGSTGKPYYFTIRNATIQFDVAPDQTYTGKLHYYQKFADLNGGNTTNWLTDNTPDLLLWGACEACSAYNREEAMEAKFNQRFTLALDELSESDADVFGPAPVMRTEASYP